MALKRNSRYICLHELLSIKTLYKKQKAKDILISGVGLASELNIEQEIRKSLTRMLFCSGLIMNNRKFTYTLDLPFIIF